MFKKRGMSPIVATVLLIAFAVALGAMVMKLGQRVPGTEATCNEIEVNTENLCNRGGVLYYFVKGQDDKSTTCDEKKIDPNEIKTICT